MTYRPIAAAQQNAVATGSATLTNGAGAAQVGLTSLGTNTLGATLSGGALVIPKTGRYRLCASLSTSTVSAPGSPSSAENVTVYIYKNGAQIATDYTYYYNNNSNSQVKADIWADQDLTAGDLITVRGSSTSSASVNPSCSATLDALFVPTKAHPR